MEAPRGFLDRLKAKPFALLVIALAFVYLGIGLLAVSFALGIPLTGGFGLILVTAASPLISGLVSRGGQGADVRIVPGAMSAAVPFSPGNLTRPVNTTVTWYNGDPTTHTVTSDTGVFASPSLTPGAWFSFTFTQKGTFPYHCAPHPNMTGIIVVT